MVRNTANEIVIVRLAPDFASGTVVNRFGDPGFDVPTTIDRFGNQGPVNPDQSIGITTTMDVVACP